jgi:DNA polymerase-3 subunit epsilon
MKVVFCANKMDFLAIDVETACADQGSICQLGVALFQSGRCMRLESRLICPEMDFSWFNSSLHGIRAEHVAQQPTWREIYPELLNWARRSVLVSHTYFDRSAVALAYRRYSLLMLPYAKWIDSCAAARRAWQQLANHKLSTLAEHFGMIYRAHDAAEDARVAGQIYLLATRSGEKTKTWRGWGTRTLLVFICRSNRR